MMDTQIIEQPKDLKENLYQHQLSLIYQMEQREEKQKIYINDDIIKTNISINADMTGYGKCLGINTPILMYNGTVKFVQDIKVNDYLMGDNSTSRQVLSLARGREMMYTIKQRYGSNYIVNKSHILSLKLTYTKKLIVLENNINIHCFDVNNKKYILKKIKYNSFNKQYILKLAKQYLNVIPNIDNKIDISVEDYLKLSPYVQKQLRGYKSSINCWKNYLNIIDIDPYFMGLLLGEQKKINIKLFPYLSTYDIYGSIKNYIKIHKHDKHNLITKSLYKYNLINNLHIPFNYKINTRSNRLKLLAGIIDISGIYQRNSYILTHKYDYLIPDIIFLCGSLGFYCEYINNFNNYNICIHGPNLTDIPVKLNKPSSSIIYKEYTKVQIVPLYVDNYYGFSISGNRRFLLGDFTVTHNTLSMVALVLRDKMEWDMDIPYIQTDVKSIAGGRIIKKTTNEYEKINTTLILVNQSIIHQWNTEFKKTPLKIGLITSRKLIDIVKVKEYDVILITPTMYNNFITKYLNITWKRFIFDEPGHIKVPGMRTIMAGFYWLVTATPDLILSKHRQCKNSFITGLICQTHNINYSIKFMILKNDENYIKQSFIMPPTYHHYLKCHNPLYTALNGLVSDKINDMISAGNISGAIKYLGGNETKNITELIKQKKFEEIEEIEIQIKIFKIRNNIIQIKKWEDKKSRLLIQIKELEDRFNTILSGDCNICFDNISEPVMEYNCQNIFCGKCILTWIKNKPTCPLCRHKIKSNELIYINKNEVKIDTIHEPQIKTKINTVIDLIKSKPDNKFIIFSAYDETFYPIRSTLTLNNIQFIELQGAVSTRVHNLEKFKTGNIQVIFLNSNNNGSGINLQEVTDIIIYHEMSVDVKTQLLGRANRIGRKIPLNVHHLVLK